MSKTDKKMGKKAFVLGALGLAAAAAAVTFLPMERATAQGPNNDPPQLWDAFGGNQQAQKYSTATQIAPDNVKLTLKWLTSRRPVTNYALSMYVREKGRRPDARVRVETRL